MHHISMYASNMHVCIHPSHLMCIDVIRVMDCTGLTYQKVRSNATAAVIPGRQPVDANSSRNGDYRSAAGRNIDDDDGGGGGGGGDDEDHHHHRGSGGSDKSSSFHASLPYANQYMLVLEPAIHQLLEYTDCDELSNRHVVMSQELRQLINAELRKFSIVAKVSLRLYRATLCIGDDRLID